MGISFRIPTTLLVWVFLFLLSGCGSSVNLQVQSEVPVPLTTRVPLNLGVYYNENFLDYVFREDSDARQDWLIDNRASRLSLFDQILPSMFNSVKPLTSKQAGDEAVDVILEPEVLEMQVALPKETRSDMYEAWLKYGMNMYHPDGRLITRWQLTGYGKTPTAIFSSNEKGLNSAIELALRDIGAKLVLGFPQAPGVREWLQGKIDCTEYPGLC